MNNNQNEKKEETKVNDFQNLKIEPKMFSKNQNEKIDIVLIDDNFMNSNNNNSDILFQIIKQKQIQILTNYYNNIKGNGVLNNNDLSNINIIKQYYNNILSNNLY